MKITKPIVLILLVSLCIIGGYTWYNNSESISQKPNISSVETSSEIAKSQLSVEVIDPNSPPDYIKEYLRCENKGESKLLVKEGKIIYDCEQKQSKYDTTQKPKNCGNIISEKLYLLAIEEKKILITDDTNRTATNIESKVYTYLPFEKTCVIILNQDLTQNEINLLKEKLEYDVEKIALYNISVFDPPMIQVLDPKNSPNYIKEYLQCETKNTSDIERYFRHYGEFYTENQIIKYRCPPKMETLGCTKNIVFNKTNTAKEPAKKIFDGFYDKAYKDGWNCDQYFTPDYESHDTCFNKLSQQSNDQEKYIAIRVDEKTCLFHYPQKTSSLKTFLIKKI